MDRLSFVVVLVAGLTSFSCKSDGGSKPTSSRQRVNAIQADEPSGPDVAGMCDRTFRQGSAPTLSWPALADDAEPPTAAKDHWQWINLWATWCKPCVEELPRLAAWQPRLAKSGAAVELVLVSGDEEAAAISNFRSQHRGTPPSLRLAEPESISTWLESLGVKGASLPVHIFVDPMGKVRCVRASAVEDTDYSAIAELVGG